MTSAHRDHQLGLLFITTAVVAWSTAGYFTRIITVDIQTLLFWRSLFGALGTLCIMAVVPRFGGLGTFQHIDRHGFAYAALTALSMLFFISAMRNTSVAHAAVITAIVPFLAAWLGWALLKEAPGKPAIIASCVALVGVAIMAGVGTDGKALGNILAALMALCVAGMILISRRHNHIPALAATCIASILTTLAMLPFATLTGIPSGEMWLLLLFGLTNQVIGFGLFAMGARLLPPSQTALLTTLEAPLAPFWVWLFLSETPGTATLIGGLMVIVAVISYLRISNP